MLDNLKNIAVTLVVVTPLAFWGGCQSEHNKMLADIDKARQKGEHDARVKFEANLTAEAADDLEFVSAVKDINTEHTKTLQEIPHANLKPKPVIVYRDAAPVECPVVSQFTPDVLRLLNRGRVPGTHPAAPAGRDGDAGPGQPGAVP